MTALLSAALEIKVVRNPASLHPSARKLPLVPGNEGAGVVIEDPSGRFSAGERVLFFAGPGGVAEDGTYAEMTSVPSGNLAALPGEIPDEIAGGLPVAYLSAFLALRRPAFARGNRFWRRASAEASAMRRSRWPVRSERRSWCQRLEARRRSPVPPPMADCTRSTSSTSSVKASPTGLPGSLLVASTSSLMHSEGQSPARRWAGWRAVAGRFWRACQERRRPAGGMRESGRLLRRR